MVSRLIHSLSGIWAPDAEEKKSNSSVDLDHELDTDVDVINNGESSNGQKHPKQKSMGVTDDSAIYDMINGGPENEKGISLENSVDDDDLTAETENEKDISKFTLLNSKPIIPSRASSAIRDAGTLVAEANRRRSESRSKSPSKVVSGREERSRSPFSIASGREDRSRSLSKSGSAPKHRSRSPSNYSPRLPYKLASTVQLLSGTLPSPSMSAHNRVNFESTFMNDSVGVQENDPKVVTATEKMLYEISEMDPNFTPRPATSPQEFRKLSLMTARSKSPVSRTTRSRSPMHRGSRSPSRSYDQDVAFVNPNSSSEGNTYPMSSYMNHAPTTANPINLQKDEFALLTDNSDSRSSSILENLDQSINEIIAEEDEEFREKYSQWIAQLFHSQLSKMKMKLSEKFNTKLEEIESDKDRSILLLNQRYEEEARSFNKTSEKFKKWVDSLEDENRRLVESKNMEVNRLEMELENVQKKFENALIKQRLALMSEAEKERQKLIDEHNSALTKLMESSKSYDEFESSAKKKLESLQRLISTLKSKNESLRRRLKELEDKNDKEMEERSRKEASAADKISKETDYQIEIMSLLNTVEDLRKRLSESDRERSALMEFHSDEVLAMTKAAEKAEMDAAKRLHKTQESLRSLKEKHERDVKDLKMQMLNQETKYNKTFTDLKHKYGNKIESLTQVIDKIQYDLK